MRKRSFVRQGGYAVVIAVAGLAGVCLAGGRESRPANTLLPPPRPASLPTAAPIPTPAPPAAPVNAESAAVTEGSGCLRILTGVVGNQIRPATPAAKPETEDCRVVDPVVVEALAVRSPSGPAQVRLLPPPTVSCELARAVSLWLDTSLQPLARGAFTRELTALRVGGGHECRRRNRQTQGQLSEHATGRALDIFAFQIGDEKQGGTAVSVERPNGLEQVRFLDAVRQSACGAFMTVLGPGSDAAHANHLHVDIQQRRAASSRFCQ
ncbi:extensin family protein [Bosea sp. LjRoot90]|uniref:extensin-like domain-containing protein n=1 Tax=Bosea sp. LjRoot90 TaxID=3342342 RepID=UPI003ECE8F64